MYAVFVLNINDFVFLKGSRRMHNVMIGMFSFENVLKYGFKFLNSSKKVNNEKNISMLHFLLLF